MTLEYLTLDKDFVATVRSGGPDANGQPAERFVSDGQTGPCRWCLKTIPKGRPALVLAARPFPGLQPYAETGPVFLCAECDAWSGPGQPEIVQSSPDYLLKGYDDDFRIVYGTGKVVPAGELADYAGSLLADPRIRHVDVRSSRNNCFLTRIMETK